MTSAYGTTAASCFAEISGDRTSCKHCGLDWDTGDPSPPACRRYTMPPTPADILRTAARTFEERNAVYKDNFQNVAMVMQGLFPGGVSLDEPHHFKVFHLLELMVVKLTRFCNSEMTHKDSIHDIAVYAAMIESLNHEGGLK